MHADFGVPFLAVSFKALVCTHPLPGLIGYLDYNTGQGGTDDKEAQMG